MSNTTTTTRPRINSTVDFRHEGRRFCGSVTNRNTLDGGFVIIYRDLAGDRAFIGSNQIEIIKVW
jgi:hypothetical protein